MPASIGEVQGSSNKTDWDNQTFFNCDSGLYFDGSNDYVNTNVVNSVFGASIIDDPFTFSCNFRCDDTNYGALMSSISNTTTDGGISLVVNLLTSTTFEIVFYIRGVGIAKNQQWRSITLIKGRTYSVTAVKSSGTGADKLNIFINGIGGGSIRNNETIALGTSIDSTLNVRFGEDLNLTGPSYYFNGFIAHPIFYDRALTADEVWRNQTHQGAPVADIHDAIVAHYPMTQQYARKIVTGDAAISKGLSIGDIAIWDCVEQYNYAKGSPLTANHAKTVNFTAGSLGDDVLTQENLELKNFYNSDVRFRPNGKKYITSDGMYDTVGSWTEFDYSDTFSFAFQFYAIENTVDNISIIFSTKNSGINQNAYFLIQYNDSDNKLYVYIRGTGGWIYKNTSITLPLGKKYNCVVSHNGTASASDTEIHVNQYGDVSNTILDTFSGTIINGDATGVIGRYKNGAGAANTCDCIIYNLEIINSVASATDIEYATKWGTFEGLGKTHLLNVDFNKQDVDLTTVTGTPAYTITPSGVTTYTKGDGVYIEGKSLFPRIAEGLEVTAGKTIAFGNLGTIKCIHFTFIPDVNTVTYFTATGITIKSDASNILSTTGLTNPVIYINGFENDELSLDSVQDVVILFDSIAVNVFASNDNINFLIRVGAKSEHYSKWQINLMNNNSLLANPFNWKNSQVDGFQDNLDEYWLAQEGRISGANWTSEVGGNTAVLTGFTIPTDIKEIGSLI